MPTTCKICASPRRDEIDARLTAGGRENSLRKIAASTGFGLRVVWNHSRHRTGNEPATATAADKFLLKHWSDLHRKSVRAGDLGTAARCLQTIADLQTRIEVQSKPAAQPGKLEPDMCPKCGTRVPVGVWKIKYEESTNTPEEIRDRIITDLSEFFQVERESAERLVVELEKAKPQDWEEINVDQTAEPQKLLETNQAEDEDAEPKPGGNGS